MRRTVPLILAIAAVTVSASCGRAPAAPPTALARTVLEARVGGAAGGGPFYCRRDMLCGSSVLPGFYRSRDFRPAWIDDGLGLAAARALPEALRQVEGDGLDPENYHLAAIEALLAEIDAARAKGPRRVRGEALADLDMLATDGFLLCASHLVHGQVNPETVVSEWSIKGRLADLTAALDRGLTQGDIGRALDDLRPRSPVYDGLRNVYIAYGALARAGGWPAVPPGPKLVKGDRAPRVRTVRATLAARGDLAAVPAAADPDLFDAALERGVAAFQDRHGLEPDGVVGAATVSALNVPPAERLMQIRANLERWRWITPDLGDRYILVNVAGFHAGVYEAGREILPMKAIVGRAYRQTPEFSGRITAITLNPPWNVPPLLAREDILPLVRTDPGYLKKKSFRVFANWAEGARELDPAAIDWDLVDDEAMPYKFRQDPGPQNSLGRVLFTFPNKFGVYLHDTPARGLFLRAARNLSSGCIRVEKALDLALYLTKDDPEWTPEKIAATLESGETKVIPLGGKARLNVHLLYWTAWLGDDGRAQFRQDIYLRDAALERALRDRFAASGPR